MKSREARDVSTDAARSPLVGRRDVVIAALGAVGAAAAAVVVPPQALAADGDIVRVGQWARASSQGAVIAADNSGSGAGVYCNSAQGDGLHATSEGAGKSAVYASQTQGDGGWGVWARGTGTGVYGESTDGPGVTARGGSQGVLATSTKGDGLRAEASAQGKSGVYAFNDVADYGYGVFARAKYTGVHGESPRFGVSGVGAGTTGEAIGCAGFGDKTGVLGAARQSSAVGVHAVNGYGGTALRVDGPVTFKRSGLANTSIGARYKAVTVPGGLVPGSKFLVTMQGSPGSGVFITYAKYQSATTFRVYFNKACTAAAKFAWMVLD